MPYKHIAAHLKKTELACRLHYHQLSHGSNRRKRTGSVTSSGCGSVAQSPVMSHLMPSPINDNTQPTTPPTYNYSPQSPVHVQLPSASILLNRSASHSPPPRAYGHPVAILPKPSPSHQTLSDATAPLHLDCNLTSGQADMSSVDKERLRQIYETHRASFWGLIASEYGAVASPLLLEETWKRGMTAHSPPTPCGTPDIQSARNVYQRYSPKPSYQVSTPASEMKTNATSIAALLGIVSLHSCRMAIPLLTIPQDASPRSPKERELIKRMEERREIRDIVMIGNEKIQRYE